MGRVNTDLERYETLNFISKMKLDLSPFKELKFKAIQDSLYKELRSYFALCAMARGSSKFKEAANSILFSTRVKLENNIKERALKTLQSQPDHLNVLLKQKFFGGSKKQGISIRLPLSSCEPTKLCSNLCYAHDVLDASPSSVIRGSLNGLIAELYQEQPEKFGELLKEYWDSQILKAIKVSHDENATNEFERESRIRFGHVGDGAAYAAFMNYLASRFKQLSNGTVKSIIYTRHRSAKDLDADLFVINFTLDPVSEDRIDFAPKDARIVYSAFGGSTSEIAEINFLEHHRFEHFSQVGTGNVCPATLPNSLHRTCDALACDKCFTKPVLSETGVND